MQAWLQWHLLGNRMRELCSCSLAPGSIPPSPAAPGAPPPPPLAAAAAESPGAGRGSAAGDTPAEVPATRLTGPPPGHPLHKYYDPARHAALHPGGPLCRRFFAQHPTVLQVGSTLFVHGGLLPSHVDYGVARINEETQAWMMGQAGDAPPRFLQVPPPPLPRPCPLPAHTPVRS